MLTGLQQLSPARENTEMRHHATAAGLTSPPQTHRQPRCRGTGRGSTSRAPPRPAVRRRGTPERAPLGPARPPAQPSRPRGPGGGSRLTHAVPDHQGRGGGRGARAQPEQRQHRHRRPERRHLGPSHDPPAARGGAGREGGTNQGRGSLTGRGLTAGAWPRCFLTLGVRVPLVPNANRNPKFTQICDRIPLPPGHAAGKPTRPLPACCPRGAASSLPCRALGMRWAHPGWFPLAAAALGPAAARKFFSALREDKPSSATQPFKHTAWPAVKHFPFPPRGCCNPPLPGAWLQSRGCFGPSQVALAIISVPGAGINTKHVDIAHLCPPWLCVLPFPSPTSNSCSAPAIPAPPFLLLALEVKE